ncbi:MAG: YicC family protein [Kordiimonadaceae bacterium]|nr:YicC family protein [Kordiimonadaceae bacterium]MBT7604758.1 YicC family protein [Kordiimonadaceae bacterium]
MTLSSMTGFGRSNNSFENYSWVWELKSVNGKGLDLRTRIPQGFDTLDKHVKSVAKKVLFRGTLNIVLQIKKDGVETVLNVNEDVLNKLIIIAKDAAIKHNLPMPSIDNLLTIRDVIEVNNDDTPDYTEKGRDKAVKLSFDEALKSLISSREEEGAATYCMLSLILDDINRLLSEAEVIGLKQPELLKEKYEKKLGSLFDNKQDIDQGRLAQEIVLLALKSDIKEETDRLNAHIVSARKLLLTNGPVGRKLEFLTQEFNREINTLCSKSSDIRLTNIGLSLKASIDQFREQVLNVE